MDQSGVFRLGDEGGRAQQPALRMLPAHQGFGPDDPCVLFQLRLEAEHELAVLQALANLRFQAQTFLYRQLHARVEEAQGVLAGDLGLVHRHVGALHQLVTAAGLAAEQHHADAGAAVQAEFVEAVRAIQRVQQLHADVFGLGRGAQWVVAEVLQHHHEFVTAEARDRVAGAHLGMQSLGGDAQDLVAGLVAMQIVDVLEVVQIDEHQRAQLVAAPAGGHGLVQAIEQQPAIGQTGQRIVEGQVVDPLLGRLAIGDVGKGGDIMGDLAVDVAYGTDGQPLGKYLAALAPVPDLAFPHAGGFDARPHGTVEVRPVSPRREQRGGLADGFGGTVPTDAAEGAVDAQDAVLRVGDQHALLGFEGDGRDAALQFGIDAVGDVAAQPDHGALLPRRLFQRQRTAFEDLRAAERRQAVFDQLR